MVVACGSSSSSTNQTTTSIPDAPASGLLATAGDQSIKLNWDAVSGADSYNVYSSNTTGTGTGGTKITGAKPPFYDNGLTNGTTYYYVVTAVNSAGESIASAEVSATPADILISSLSFTDTNLQSCVTTTATNGPLTYVHELTTLVCQSQTITSLSGIEALTSLASLNLYDNNISDVSPLAGLTLLTTLNLYKNSISDVSPLAGLTALSDLSLGQNSISDVSPLSGLTSLTTNLDLGYNSISDLSPLSGLTSLTDLDLYANSISDVTPLASLTALTHLYIGNNSFSDVTPLASLTNLTELHINFGNIGGQGIGHVDALGSLTSATVIDLRGNTGMSCSELSSLISTLGSPPVDTDNNTGTTDTATDGVNCTSP